MLEPLRRSLKRRSRKYPARNRTPSVSGRRHRSSDERGAGGGGRGAGDLTQEESRSLRQPAACLALRIKYPDEIRVRRVGLEETNSNPQVTPEVGGLRDAPSETLESRNRIARPEGARTEARLLRRRIRS